MGVKASRYYIFINLPLALLINITMPIFVLLQAKFKPLFSMIILNHGPNLTLEPRPPPLTTRNVEVPPLLEVFFPTPVMSLYKKSILHEAKRNANKDVSCMSIGQWAFHSYQNVLSCINRNRFIVTTCCLKLF